MAAEEPQVRTDIQFGAYQALAVGAAVVADVGDAIEHQHRIVGQATAARAEQFTAGAGQQLFARERVETSHGKRNPEEVAIG
ncbi:hypothetical protein D3C72_1500180 [compost metagenome]